MSTPQDLASVDRRILIAEDDREMRRLVADALRKEGYQVLEVETGEELFLWLAHHLSSPVQNESVDLVLTDIRMPGRTGLDVIASLVETGWRVPVIFMTGFGDDYARHRAAELGARLLAKPFPIEQLTAAVKASLT